MGRKEKRQKEKLDKQKTITVIISLIIAVINLLDRLLNLLEKLLHD